MACTDKPPPIKDLYIHVYVGNQRVYSGILDRQKHPLQWIPSIMDSASSHLGKKLKTMQTHPNDLSWTYNEPNMANLWVDSLKIDAKFM